MNNISNSPSIATIEVIRSKTHVYGIGCAGFNSVDIFIPSKQLLISSDGYVRHSEVLPQSRKAALLGEQYLSDCNQKKKEFNYEEYMSLTKQANEGEKVQVSLLVVNEIDTLFQELQELENKKKTIESRIADLAKQLF